MNRFVIADPHLCIGCNTCMAACSETHKQQGLQNTSEIECGENRGTDRADALSSV
ncbi:Hydrogenase-4 component A [Morganella morganii]|nr:Hydrogenase-4 component A [Morganella morganii]